MTAPARTPAPTNPDGSLKMDDEPAPAPNFPRVVLQTLVEYDGKTWLATFNDTAIDTAALIIERRGCTIMGMGAGNPTGQAAGTPPTCPNKNCSRYGQLMEPSQHKPGFYCKGGKDPVSGNAKGYCKAEVN